MCSLTAKGSAWQVAVSRRPKSLSGSLRTRYEALGLFAQGVSQEDPLQDYPRLESKDIRACVAYAHAVVAGDSLAAVSVAGG